MNQSQDQLNHSRPSVGMHAVFEAFQVLLLIFKVAAILLLAGFCLSGIRNNEQYEKALILQFGQVKIDRIKEAPGLVLALPYPINEIIKIPAKRTQSLTLNTFWYGLTDEEKKTGVRSVDLPPGLTPGVDGYLLTTDRHIVHAQGVLKYRITDPIHYAFSHHHYEDTLRALVNNVILKVVAATSLEDTLFNKNRLSATITEQLQKQLDQAQMGVTIDPLDLQITWPRHLIPIANDVITARQQYQQELSRAHHFANNLENETTSSASQVILKARDWATRKISRVESDGNTFKKLYPLYKQNPEVIKQTLFQDRMRQIMANVDEIFMVNDREDQEIRLNLSRLDKNRTPQKETPGKTANESQK